MYDYLIVGSGLYGAMFAYEAKKRGKKCLVIDKRNHIGGNIYCENIEGINVHKYGAHIFHTSDKKIWNYINTFAEFNNYINSPVAIYKDELYNLPFNMNTFSKLWGIKTPAEAKKIIADQIADLNITEPKNLEEQALSLVGKDVYQKLIKVFLLVVIQRLSKKCLMALMFLLTQTILNGLRIAIMQQVSRKRSLQDLSTNSITIAMVFSNIVLFALKQKFLIQITIRVTLW